MRMLLLALSLVAAGALAQSDAVPKHVAIARELVENIRPDDNQYKLGGTYIAFPGDALSSKYALRADCSGFLLALYRRAGYDTESQMAFLPSWKTRRRPASEDFVYSIENGKGYRRIERVADFRAGDLLAHAMLNEADKKEVGTTGHVFLLNGTPKPIAPRNPVVDGTTQYEVSIIDSNEEWVGSDDTRLADAANKVKGLGRGTIRLYAAQDGTLVGWGRTFKNTNRFFSYSPAFPSDTRARKAAVGRPLAAR